MKHCSIVLTMCALLAIPTACGFDTTVRFGVVTPQSGQLAAFGPSWLNGIEMSADHINQGGGVLGRKLEIVSIDSGGNPTDAAAAALDMIAAHRCSAVIVADGSAVARAVADALLPKGMLVMCSSATTPAIADVDDNNLLWRTAPSDLLQGAYMARQCLSRGFTQASILYQDDDYGRGIRDGFSQAYSADNCTVLDMLSCGSGQSSYLSELSQLFAQNPDIIILPTYGNNAKVILNQWHGLGLGGRWMLSEANYDPGLLTAGDSVEGAFVVECASNPQSGFEQMYAQRYGATPLTFTAHAYDAIMLLALAAEKAGCSRSRAVADNLRAISGQDGTVIGIGPEQYTTAVSILKTGGAVNYEGASGAIDFNAAGEVTAAVYHLWQIHNNAFVDIEEQEK